MSCLKSAAQHGQIKLSLVQHREAFAYEQSSSHHFLFRRPHNGPTLSSAQAGEYSPIWGNKPITQGCCGPSPQSTDPIKWLAPAIQLGLMFKNSPQAFHTSQVCMRGQLFRSQVRGDALIQWNSHGASKQRVNKPGSPVILLFHALYLLPFKHMHRSGGWSLARLCNPWMRATACLQGLLSLPTGGRTTKLHRLT